MEDPRELLARATELTQAFRAATDRSVEFQAIAVAAQLADPRRFDRLTAADVAERAEWTEDYAKKMIEFGRRRTPPRQPETHRAGPSRRAEPPGCRAGVGRTGRSRSSGEAPLPEGRHVPPPDGPDAPSRPRAHAYVSHETDVTREARQQQRWGRWCVTRPGSEPVAYSGAQDTPTPPPCPVFPHSESVPSLPVDIAP
ncbi:hypothetical protein SCALM49S_02018 [Streptomyces californicus]